MLDVMDKRPIREQLKDPATQNDIEVLKIQIKGLTSRMETAEGMIVQLFGLIPREDGY